MSDFHDAARNGLSAGELEAVLRAVGAERYHNRHPYHHRMTSGDLSKGELQAWALNRYCYQAVIPRKDATILAHAADPAFRAEWRKRIEDHDGDDGWSGGIARWLHLATSLGLEAEAVKSERLALPATRFAVGAYLSFCADRSLLEAVAAGRQRVQARRKAASQVAEGTGLPPSVSQSKACCAWPGVPTSTRRRSPSVRRSSRTRLPAASVAFPSSSISQSGSDTEGSERAAETVRSRST